MAGNKGRKKRSICAQTIVPDVSVAQVARRYSMNANLIHGWLKDPRFAPVSEIDEAGSDPDFLPIEIEGSDGLPIVDEISRSDAAVSAQRVDITLSDGRRILVEGAMELTGVLGLIKGMMP